ncbi:dihydrofolate reductase family protein [Actinacidiphila rubida]|uniref:RibD C-terminal domain-containing protein n=1 Tax=Actinacidiphila rubida TaxID=310780 RepID=A0A1H8T643_9ACTN|nr:dihydrofolate reductase family protein [Actinacidiphila rubida]SEO86008.1 RibD C-terminal domain-containing protein [Actinacidiphila rubida]
MGRIVIGTNTALDGVVQDPDGQEGTPGGGWFTDAMGADREAWAEHEMREAAEASALLLGGRSDAWFASRWLSREGAWADRLNAIPKYVVSSTLQQARWSNATVLAGDPVKEVAELRRTVDGDIVVYGSLRLARTLIANDLADELRLMVFPVVAGSGGRLLDEAALGGTRALRLLETRRIGGQLVLQTYAFAR